jgi:hypothetical protein
MKFQITVICSETRSITPEQAKEEYDLGYLPTEDEIVALLENDTKCNIKEFHYYADLINIEITKQNEKQNEKEKEK